MPFPNVPSPRRGWRWPFLAFLVLVIVVVLYVIFGRGGSSDTTGTVTRGQIAQDIETSGTLQPVKPVTVRGTASGLVELVAVQPGDHVQAGDIVAQLDRGPFTQAMAGAEQQLAAAQLAETVAQATPVANNPLPDLAAFQRVTAAKAAVATAQTGLNNAALVSPVSGTVLDVEVANGQPYQAGSPAVTINAGDQIEATIDLDEIDVPHIKPGTNVQLTVDAFPGTPLQGVIATIMPSGTSQNGGTVFPATVSIANTRGLAIRPGMSVDATVPSTVIDNALLVPDGAITTVGRRSFVTVVSDGHSHQVEVTIGLRANGQVQITSGNLKAGDRVRLGS